MPVIFLLILLIGTFNKEVRLYSLQARDDSESAPAERGDSQDYDELLNDSNYDEWMGKFDEDNRKLKYDTKDQQQETNQRSARQYKIEETFVKLPIEKSCMAETCKHEHHDPCKNKGELKSKLEHALPLLEKISAEIAATKEKDVINSRNGFSCSVNGLWESKIGGAKLELVTHEDGRITVTTNCTEEYGDGILKECPWHISGLLPSKREAPFALAAVCTRDHRIATFLGQCKVCENSDTIFGTWMFSRIARDCAEAISAVETKCDIWRKVYTDDESTETTTCSTPILPNEE